MFVGWLDGTALTLCRLIREVVLAFEINTPSVDVLMFENVTPEISISWELASTPIAIPAMFVLFGPFDASMCHALPIKDVPLTSVM